MPDHYLRDSSGAVTGPHSADFLRNRASSGGIGPAHAVAVVPDGERPGPEDFRPFSDATLRPSTSPGAAAPTGRAGGGLRTLGLSLGALAVVAGVIAAAPAGPTDSFDVAVFLGALVSGAFAGGVLWGLGAILRALTAPST